VTSSKRIITIMLVLVVLIGFDHVTKWAAIHYLKEASTVYRLPGDVFRLQYAENTGAFLSLGEGLPNGIRTLVMTGLNAVILGGLLLYVFLNRHLALLPLCAFSLVAAGGIGNLLDRVFRDGRVVDFMNMGITSDGFTLRTGIFNIADVAIMGGLFLIVAGEVIAIRKSKTSKQENSSPKR
jgi:signal peptidase II